MECSTSLEVRPPRALLVVSGDFDAAETVELWRQLDDAVRDGCVSFRVDLSGVTFADAAALGTLARLHNVVAPRGGEVVVSAASAKFRWVADAAGLRDAFGLDLLQGADAPPRSD